jgi:nucleotide-binding universal stress UspA family protein
MNAFADKPILVPVDLSAASDRALDYALELATAPELVTALHVGLPYTAVEPPYMYLVDEQSRHDQLEAAVLERFAAPKYSDVHIEIRYGDPGHEIADFARESSAGLIVMPSHGRTGLAHLLVGSVAERVVRYAPCPVLVLRGLKAHAEQDAEFEERVASSS